MAVVAGLVVSALGPVIEVAKLVYKPIGRQLNYLCCFTSNISSLKDEAKSLDDALAGLERQIEAKRNNNEDPLPLVETWLTKSKEMKDEISGILSEASNVGSACWSKLGARSLSRRAKRTTESAAKLIGKKPSADQFLQRPHAATQEVELGKIFECESRNKIEEEIMTTMRVGDKNMVGICGMGGLGKTTMAKKLMNRALKEKIFEEVVIATVSQNVVIAKIQDEIGGQLGLDKLKEEKSESARAKMLHSRLSDTNRTTLLVLDDVWDTLTLEDFGIPRHSIGCTILFTSRNRDMLHAMDDVQIFGMKVLSEDEAWFFFRERVGTCAEDMALNHVAKQVAKECGGMPINLAAVGAVLKDKPMQRLWNHTLDQLKQCVPNNVRYDKQNYNPLTLSYEYLKSEDHSKPAESIFLLCCLFPEDVDIPLEYLTYFCMGLRIFEDNITNMEKARDLIWTKTELLKDRSLLLESDTKDCVRIHDVVRDVCSLIAKEEGYISKNGGRWISSSHLVGESNELLSRSSCPNLNLLFLNGIYDSSGFKFDNAFQKGIAELNVLCIERYSFTTLPHLTQSLGNLKTLTLVKCAELKTISAVGELVNLEILVCLICESIKMLPSEMKGLNCLKVLDLRGCYKLQSIGRGIISSLVGLEELKMYESFKRWEAEEREERENASIKELEALTNLACLEIDIEDPSILMENMSLLSNKIVRFNIRTDIPLIIRYRSSEFSKAMSLRLERESRLGAWIETQFLRDTEYLYLRGEGANNVDLGKCQNIRWLELESCESIQNVVRTSGGLLCDDATVFPSLEHLQLESLPKLQEICDGPISSTSLHNLKELTIADLRALTQFWKSSCFPKNNNVPHFTNLSSIEIQGCHSLRNLGQLSMAGKDCLPHLTKLHIIRCLMMEQVFLWNDDEEAADKNKTSILITKVFPKLKEVDLYNLQNLTTFYQGIQGIEFPLLQKLMIIGCPKWKSINDGSNSADFDEDGSSQLLCQPQKIVFGSSFKVLWMDHNPFSGHEIPSSLFNGLEVLTINKYEGSMSLFTLSVAANLISLRELRITFCKEMTNVIEDEQHQERILVFPKLEELYMNDSPKLVSFCNSKCEVELPLLRKVDIDKCPNMENFSMGFVATPNLEAFETDLSTNVGVGVDVAFDSLKDLAIKSIENSLNDYKISESLFSGLEKLFCKCERSMSLFSSSAVGNLVNLKILIIESCAEIVKLIEDEEEKEDGKVVSGSELRTVVFPKLEWLDLGFLPKLVSFCEWKCDVELPSLRVVVIKECPNMENFSMGCVSAPNLEIVKMGYNDDDGKKIGGTKDLNGLLQQHCLKALQFNRNPFYGHEIPSSAYNRLEKLTISKYEGSMSLFTLSMAAIPVNLRKLYIQNCDEMINVIEDEKHQERIILFPNLQKLYLKKLPKLVSFCISKCEVEFPSLRKVVIERCPNMEKFSLGVVATPNLEALTTDLSTYVGVGVRVGDSAAFTSLKRLKITKNENSFHHHRISVFLFNGLEQLVLFEFKGSVSLFSPSAVRNLVNLEFLSIGGCYEIVKLIEDEEEKEDGKVVSGGELRTVVFPKLEVLALCLLPKLASFCEWKRDVELPSLRVVVIGVCPNMENFSMGLVATPNLEIVKIDEEEIDTTKDLNGLLQQHYLAHQQKENQEEESSQGKDETEEEDDDEN